MVEAICGFTARQVAFVRLHAASFRPLLARKMLWMFS
jgi:hypothetical protein